MPSTAAVCTADETSRSGYDGGCSEGTCTWTGSGPRQFSFSSLQRCFSEATHMTVQKPLSEKYLI